MICAALADRRVDDAMNMHNGNTWKAVLLLSVVVPMSLIVSFKLSGFAGKSLAIAETVTLEPAQWEFERPRLSIDFNDTAHEHSYILRAYPGDICLSQVMSISVFTDASMYDDSPLLGVFLTLNGSVEGGYVENINITYTDDYTLSHIILDGLDKGGTVEDWAFWQNLTLARALYGGSGVEKGFVSLDRVGYPDDVRLGLGSGWLMESPNNQTQQLTINVEVTYFNGTLYKKIVQPFQIRLFADDDNTFDTATEIESNQTMCGFLGFSETVQSDLRDFYKMYLKDGEIINLTGRVLPPVNLSFDLLLFEPGNRDAPVQRSREDYDLPRTIGNYVVNLTGWWFIKLQWSAGSMGGLYTLDLRVTENIP
jgi:hypothetical protein